MEAQDPGRQALIQEQLRDIERSRLRALVDGDLAVARSLHADDF
ncbi:hypothetical protein ACQ4WY_00990 [Janthinobacterium sp. LB2P49]